jgi:hypothetical protein
VEEEATLEVAVVALGGVTVFSPDTAVSDICVDLGVEAEEVCLIVHISIV